MTNGHGTQPPIGSLLRALDRHITQAFEWALGSHDVTRRQWQLLNVLVQHDTVAFTDLDAAVAPFLEAGDTARPHLELLAARGYVEIDGDAAELSDAGLSAYAELAALVGRIRERLVEGLPEGEYDRIVAGLQIMLANFERDAGEPPRHA